MTKDLEFEMTMESPSGFPLDLRQECLEPGEIFDRYTVLSLIGRGGMGQVYSAYDPKLDRRVALKILNSTGSYHSQKAKRRLGTEAKSLAQLNHPNVVGVFDVGEVDDQVFMAMEYLDGRHLGQWVAEESPSWAEILSVIRAAARGLAAVHELGLVHRDVKPANIVVPRKGEVRVIDFGIARSFEDEDLHSEEHKRERMLRGEAITEAGSILGTPQYMAKEQFYGNSSHLSDQFSLAISAYEALYGQSPFSGDSIVERAQSMDKPLAPPAHPEVPDWIFPVLQRALSVDPKDRFQSITEFCEALELPSDNTIEEHLRTVEREHNPHVASHSRHRAGLALFLVVLSQGLYFLARTSDQPFTPSSPPLQFLQICVVAIGFVSVFAIWRKTFWANQYNRQWVLVAVGIILPQLFQRAIGIITNQDATTVLQTGNLLLGGCVFMCAHLSRSFYLLGFAIIALSGFAIRFPSSTRMVSNISSVFCVFCVWLLWRRLSVDAAKESEEPVATKTPSLQTGKSDRR